MDEYYSGGAFWEMTTTFRWARPEGTTTRPDVLQQLQRNLTDGSTRWVNVPVQTIARADPSATTSTAR